MAHGHSHGGVACDGNHDKAKKKKKKKKKKGGRSNNGSRGATSKSKKKKKKKGKALAPMCDCKKRGLPRHCCCHELCFGWNGCGPRHNIKHLPMFECTDKKKYRPGQRRRHSRCFYCYRNLGNWLTAFFILIGLGGAIAALVLYLAPCSPNITYNTYLQNRTLTNSSVVKQTNYNYDGANVVLMLDFSGSIGNEWVSEVESAEQVLSYFKNNLDAQAPFRAASIIWGGDPAFMETSGSASNWKAGGVDGSGTGEQAKLTDDIDLIDRALVYAKTYDTSGGTYFKAPFFWFQREIKERGTGAVDIDPSNTHHNFAVFITDGEASDYTGKE